MTVGDFSVLLPVYAGDQPEFFFRSVSSATREQEVSPKQLVVVCDGPVDEGISDFLHRASRGEETDVLGHIDVRVVRLKHNMGLANALNIGLAHCSHDIVARVDADDISLPQRFAIQIPLVEGGLGLLGSAIQEFSDDEACAFHADQRRRDPSGHFLPLSLRAPLSCVPQECGRGSWRI